MNFLSGSLYRGGGRVITTPCYRKAVMSIISFDVDKMHKICVCSPKTTRWPNVCPGNVCVSPVLPMRPQVRYKMEGPCPSPRLHRDMEFPNFDHYRKDDYKDVRKTSWGSGDGKPGFTYVVGVFGIICGAYAVKNHAIHYIMYMSAAADVLALAQVEVDLSKVLPGACMSVKWRGKPLFIKNRTQQEIDVEASTPMANLRDPQKESDRCSRPEWLVVIGICTHLGCVPVPNSGDYVGGFYCPCHGSHYDNIGRIRKGPAPLNLVIPPHVFLSDTVVRVG